MDLIVRTITKIIFPFSLLVGVYIALHGHLSPGGGFPAGVIIGTAFLLLLISSSTKMPDKQMVRLRAIAGMLFIAVIIIEGFSFALRGQLMSVFGLWSGGITFLLNVSGGLIVVIGIILLIYSLERMGD